MGKTDFFVVWNVGACVAHVVGFSFVSAVCFLFFGKICLGGVGARPGKKDRKLLACIGIVSLCRPLIVYVILGLLLIAYVFFGALRNRLSFYPWLLGKAFFSFIVGKSNVIFKDVPKKC